MLEGVGSSVARGRDTTMLREILDRTAERIRTEIGSQPVVEAELSSLIGRLYLDVGNYEKAEIAQRRALEIYRRLFGAESVEAAAALSELAQTLWRKGMVADAGEMHREALAIRRRRFGDNHPDVAASINGLAGVYRRQGKLAEAEKLIRDALEIRRKFFGNDHLEVADSLHNLTIVLGDEGRMEDAEATARNLLAMRERLLGNEHLLVAAALVDLAWVKGGNGKPAEAEALELRALAMRRKLLGENHPEVAKAFYLVGDRARQLGKPDEAKAYLQKAVAMQKRLLRDDDPATTDSLRSLVLTLEAGGNFEDALNVLNEYLNDVSIKQASSAKLLQLRMDLFGRKGQWLEAARDAALAVELEPVNHELYHNLAALSAISKDRPSYDEVCRKIVRTFGETSNPYVADRVAKDCLLLRATAVDLSLIGRLADIAVARGKDMPGKPFFEVCKSLYEYRSGHFREALEWADKPLKNGPDYARAQAYAIQAMARYRIGNTAAAGELLAKAKTLVAPNFSPHSNDEASNWLPWIFARVSLDEAMELVSSVAK
jgi:tetratricopeptide (TPR) repeat protein